MIRQYPCAGTHGRQRINTFLGGITDEPHNVEFLKFLFHEEGKYLLQPTCQEGCQVLVKY